MPICPKCNAEIAFLICRAELVIIEKIYCFTNEGYTEKNTVTFTCPLCNNILFEDGQQEEVNKFLKG